MIRRLSGVVCFVLIGLLLPVLFIAHDTERVKDLHVSTAERVNQSLVVETQRFVAGSSDTLPPVYDGRARSHFVDVRDLVVNAEILIAALFVAALLLSASRKVFFETGLSLFGVGVFLGALTYIDFSFVFDWFHRLVFPPGTYTFAESSLPIALFPSSFFKAVVFDAVVGWLAACLGFVCLGFIRRR